MKKDKVINLMLILVALAIIIVVIFLFGVNDKRYNATLQLYGDMEVTLYQGEEYVESGYLIVKQSDDNRNYQVNVINKLNINVLGDYIIKYQLLYNNKIIYEVNRNIKVVTNSLENVRIDLNGDSVSYVWVNEKYEDEGVTAYNGTVDITDQVKVLGTVNSDKVGTYELEYSITLNGIKKSVKRTVKVVSVLVNEQINYNQSRIELNIVVNDFNYVSLPNGGYSYDSNITYPIDQNGIYEFIIYTKYGFSKKYVVNINDYDNNPPTGSCIATISNNSTKVIVTAEDENEITKYVYNNKIYDTNTFIINGEVNNIVVNVYDKFDNFVKINCYVKRIFDNNMNVINSPNVITPCKNDWTHYNNELNQKIQEIGYKTRDAVAFAADYLAKFDYMVAYSWGGKYLQKGINPNWGCEVSVSKEVCSKSTGDFECILGLDCTGYTSWAFLQAGFDKSILRTSSQSTGNWGNFKASKHKYSFVGNQDKVQLIKPGDLVHTEGHVGIVIGTSDTQLKVANMHDGVLISYINKSNGKSVNGDKNFDNFVLFDDFFKMYGSTS